MGNHRQREEIRNGNPFKRPPSLAQLTNSMVEDESSAALAIHEDGSIQLGAYILTPIGLQLIGKSTYEEWEQLGAMLRRLDGAIQWLIGDWLVEGEMVHGQTYEAIAQATGYDPNTLYQFRWVASSIHISLRREKLSFGHHKLVARLDPDQQRQWLNYAAQNNLSIAQMRAAIEGKSAKLPGGTTPVDRFQHIFMPFQQRLKSIVKKAGQGERAQIADWLRAEADKIERSELD